MPKLAIGGKLSRSYNEWMKGQLELLDGYADPRRSSRASSVEGLTVDGDALIGLSPEEAAHL